MPKLNHAARNTFLERCEKDRDKGGQAHNILLRYRNRYLDNSRAFYAIFGVALKPYWCNITGFDVIKFDDFIKPPRNKSTRETILKKYGQEGVDMIEKLIGNKEQPCSSQ